MSGGADSLALLLLAAEAGCDVTAVHVDHGLRPESAAEAAVVADAAARVGAGFRSVRIDVAPGPNLEARARAARRAALGPDAATGHTADDQAETVLINLLRGAGLDGLAGMRPGPRHPILALRRAETHALCAAAGLVPVVDASNADPAYVRNRVRLELLPLMNAIAARDLVPVLARQAGVLRHDSDLLDALAAPPDGPAPDGAAPDGTAAGSPAPDGTGPGTLDARALAALPESLARRRVRAWLRTDHPPGLAAVERVLAVARGEAVACEVGGGVTVRRSANRLSLVGPDTLRP